MAMLCVMMVMTIMVVTVCHDTTVGSVHEEVKGDLDANQILINGYNAMKSREALRNKATETAKVEAEAKAAKAAKKIKASLPKPEKEQDALDALPPAMAAIIKKRQDDRRQARATAEMHASLDIPKEAMLLQVPTAPAAHEKAECKDSAEWHVKGAAKQNCKWVGWEQYPTERRCDQKDAQGVAGHQACKLVCGTCGAEPPSVADHGSILTAAAADVEEELLQVTNFEGEEVNEENLPESMALQIQHHNARNAMHEALSGAGEEDTGEEQDKKSEEAAEQVFSGEMPDTIRHKIAVRNARTAMAQALSSGFEDDLN